MPIASFRMVEAAKLKLEDSELEDRFLSGAPDAGYRKEFPTSKKRKKRLKRRKKKFESFVAGKPLSH